MNHILVTGAKGNLGSAVVKKFLLENCKVIACISQHDNELGIEHHDLEVFPLDLANHEACQVFAETIIPKYKSIDTLILTVGGFSAGDLETVTKMDFDKMFALNFMTAFNIVQAFFKQMKNQSTGGKIFLIGAEPGRDGSKSKNNVAYGFTKSLLFRLAELINEEGNENNITAFVVVPTTMDTPQNRASMPGADFSKWTSPFKIAEEIYDLNFIHSSKIKKTDQVLL